MSRPQLAAIAIALSALGGACLGFLVNLGEGAVREQALVAKQSAAVTKQARELHGQAKWAPRERPAPPISLADQDGTPVTLASLRGRPVLLTFFDSRCVDRCPIEGRQLGIMLREMPPALRPTVLIVSVNPSGDTPESISKVMAEWRLAGPWRWHWLRGTAAQLARVWSSYGVAVDFRTGEVVHGMTVYLIDRRGFERTAYVFPFLPNFVGRDLRVLARES